jgi:hypothetical protein
MLFNLFLYFAKFRVLQPVDDRGAPFGAQLRLRARTGTRVRWFTRAGAERRARAAGVGPRTTHQRAVVRNRWGWEGEENP